eukprot:1009065-Rhodomonas_salina.1
MMFSDSEAQYYQQRPKQKHFDVGWIGPPHPLAQGALQFANAVGALQFANAVLEDTEVQFTSAEASEDGGINGTSIIDDQIVIYGEKATMMKVGRRLPDITAASETPLCAELDEGSTE